MRKPTVTTNASLHKMRNNQELTPKKNHYLLWRKKKQEYISESYISEIVDTPFGILLELTDSKWSSTSYPNRVLLKEIQIIKVFIKD